MMKNVQISQELFVALLHYHLSGENEYEEVIEQGLSLIHISEPTRPY